MALDVQVVFDAADPASLAEFWAAAAGYIVQPPPAGFDSWEAFLAQIGVARTEADRLVRLARIVREYDENGEFWIVLTDPEGNEFCVS